MSIPRGFIYTSVESVSMKHLYNFCTTSLIWRVKSSVNSKHSAISSRTLLGTWFPGSKKNLWTLLFSTSSMFIPPLGDATTAMDPEFLSSRKERYNSFLKKIFSTKNTSLHFFPVTPVWGVTRVFPIIFYAYSRTSEALVAVWTPPFNPDYLNVPFPLPPAWTWAFITTSTKGLFLETDDMILWAMA